MQIQELIAYPEHDEWRYQSQGGIRAYTSAEFVVEALQQLGVIDDTLQLNFAEFSVKDIYELQIYDKFQDKPDQCNEADLYLRYCQLLGETRIELDEYSTRVPHEWMAESCPNPFATNKKIIGC